MYQLHKSNNEIFIQQELLSIGVLSLVIVFLYGGTLSCYGLWQLLKYTAQVVFS